MIDSRQEIVPSFSQAVTVPQGSTTWKQQKFQTSLQYQGNNHGKAGWRNAIPPTNMPEENTEEFFQALLLLLLLQLCLFSIPESSQQ